MMGTVKGLYHNNPPESMDYLALYCMGTLKNEIFFPAQNLQANAYIDKLNYMRYQLRQMGSDELMNIIWPQLFQVSEETLSSENLPPLLNLSRA